MGTISKEALELHKKWRNGDPTGIRITLTDAYLRGADLRGADLTGAYLRGAYLTGADLTGADLRGADLTYAHLKGADLTGADLTGADLTGAYLTGAKSILTFCPIGSRGDMLIIYYHEGWRVKTGCFDGTIKEFANRVKATHGDNKYGQQYNAVIKCAKAWIKTKDGK